MRRFWKRLAPNFAYPRARTDFVGRSSLIHQRDMTTRVPCSFPAIMAESFGGPEVLKMGQKSLPALGENDVIVEVKAAGINPSDTYMRLGPHGPWAATPHLLPKPPFTPGKDGAGVVAEIGSKVDDLSVGQRVYLNGSISGTYAAYCTCSATTVHPLPDQTSFAQGACVGVPCATAYHALRHRARASAGQRVFIHGASGAVGLAAVQLAKDIGCFVVGTAGSAAGVELVTQSGADRALNHREEGYMQLAKDVAPGGYDVILEMAAHANLVTDFQIAGKRSCICIIGSKAQDIGFNPRLAMPSEIDVRGVFLGTATTEEKAEMKGALYDAMQRGVLKPMVGMELPLADAPKGHMEVMEPSRGGAQGNIVLVVSTDPASA